MKKVLILFMFVLQASSFSSGVKEKKFDDPSKYFDHIAYHKLKSRMVSKIKNYNKIRNNPSKIASSFMDDKEAQFFKIWMKENAVKKLPKIYIRKGKAIMNYKGHKIVLTPESILQGHYYLNGNKVVLEQSSFGELLSYYKRLLKKKKSVTMLDLFISKAHAAEAEIEHIIIGTMIYLNNDFVDHEWCIWCGNEIKAQTITNFQKLLNSMSVAASKCENEDGDTYDISLNMEAFDDPATTYVRDEVKLKLDDYFGYYTKGGASFNCEVMASEIFRSEMASKMKSKFAMDSMTAYNNREHNAKVYEDYIKRKCRPYIRLRNCLLRNDYTAKEIYNDIRGNKGKKPVYKIEPIKEYKPKSVPR